MYETTILEKGGLIKVKNANLSFSIIKRNVFEKFISNYGELKINDTNIDKKYQNYYYDIFKGGDTDFCERYNKINGKIMVDTTISIIHIQNLKIPNQLLSSLKFKE
jgi:hypothetical protein